MRIRTIKPAFWSNERMAMLDEFSRLLALGLLNYADDQGYFWANPLLIRAALFPFDDDSAKVRRSLQKLQDDGYLKLGKTADGRECGFIVNFSKHQRVDKPQDSEIQDAIIFDDDSSNDPRTLDDQSSLYGIVREGKGREGKEAQAPVVLPFHSELFQSAWSDFGKHRSEIRKPLKPTMTKGILAELERMGEARAIAAIRHTIAKGWQGIREPEAQTTFGGQRPAAQQTENWIPANLR